MAYRHVYVDPDATDTPENGTTWGKAYASLNAAEQAEDNTGDIRATGGSNEIVVFHCRASAGTADTDAVTVNGWTTDSGGYIVIVAEAIDTSYGGGSSETTGTGRHHGVWSASHYRLDKTGGTALAINEDYVRIEGLQVTTSTPSANSQHGIYFNLQNATTNQAWIGGCLIKGHAHATYTQGGIWSDDGDLNLVVYNSIVYGINAITNNRAFAASGTTVGIYGCTLIGGEYGIRMNAATLNAKNTYVGGSATEDFLRNSGTVAKTNCASEDTSASDTGASETATNCVTGIDPSTSDGEAAFTNVTAGSENFTLKSTSALIGAGATLTDDPPGATALGVDIIGTTRS